MEITAKIAMIAMIIFVAMVVTMLIVQIVVKRRVKNKAFAERKKALHRMSDSWFRAYYENAKDRNWTCVSPEERKALELERERRNLNI